MATSVQFSANESDILGLKVGRCNADWFDEQILLDQILQGRYDICRLKIPAEDEYASLKLQRIGCPFFFSGSIRRYETRISEKPTGSFLHPDMQYEMYDGSQHELLLTMLRGTWGDYPLGYYRTPYLDKLIDKEKEIQSVFNFYRHHNLPKNNPNNGIAFMKDGDHYVGFFAMNKVDGHFESHIGGILEPYRKGGYFLDMLRYIKNYCVDQQLSHFHFGARNENAYVQKIFQDVGFKAVGTENVFHIVPLLSYSTSGHLIQDLATTTSYSDVFNAVHTFLQNKQLSIQDHFSFKQIHSLKDQFPSQLCVSIILTDDSTSGLVSFQTINAEKEITGFGYCDVSRR